MNLKRASVLLAVLIVALPVVAGTDDLLSLVPADAVSVGVVRVDELRNGEFAGMLFEQTSDLTTDGEALLFLQESGLDPMTDIDAVLFAMLPRAGSPDEGDLLVLVEGKFDPVRLAAAVVRKGPLPASAGGVAYYRIQSDDEHDGRHPTAAVSFPSTRMAIAGTEAAVVKALEARAAGGSTFLSASNIGRDLKNIDRSASAWAMMDVPRAARMGKSMTEALSGDESQSFGKALRYVSTLGVWASERRGNLEFGGVALSSDDETRALLEDVVRGITAAWRMAAREENPEWLPVIRSFEIGRDRIGVNIKGSIPVSLLRDHHQKVATR